MKRYVAFGCLVVILMLRASDAFVPLLLSRPPSSFLSQASAASKSICTFDPDDFALGQGEWPYTDADLNRLDNSDDASFYDEPRFVTHIDDGAIAALTKFYQSELSQLGTSSKVDFLDLCSSWISHLPDTTKKENKGVSFGRVVGVGMNEKELAANEQLTEYHVMDLNHDPTALKRFDDNSFDVIANVVSVDYLTNPRKVFEEIHRILRPGGVALMSFSNRCFATKAVAMWLQTDDIGRMTIVASYFHYTAKWKTIEALDLKDEKLETPDRPALGDIFSNPAKGWAWMNTVASVQKANSGDPMYVVKAVK